MWEALQVKWPILRPANQWHKKRVEGGRRQGKALKGPYHSAVHTRIFTSEIVQRLGLHRNILSFCFWLPEVTGRITSTPTTNNHRT